MTLRYLLTRKKVIAGSCLILAVLIIGGFFWLRKAQRVRMEKYVPAGVLAFLEIDSLADLADGLTDTDAWRELAPLLGMSSQLRQLGSVADLVGRTGLGPDEAVVAGRAQFAIAVTEIESQTGVTEEGPFIHLKPAFCLIIETHASPRTAERLVRDRASIIAERIFGLSVTEHSDTYEGSSLRVFEGPGSGHQLIVASTQSVILVANQKEAARTCLDAITLRTESLEQDKTLNERKREVGADPSVFGYITEKGVGRLTEMWPLLVAGTSAEPDRVASFADLIEHLSSQSGAVLLYSLSFEQGGVTERYLTVLRPQLAQALAEPFKASTLRGFKSLASIPRDVEGVTLLSVVDAGELPQRLLKQLAPNLDIVAGVTLREFVINLRKQYGLEPKDSLADALGDEIALVDFGDSQSRALYIAVKETGRVTPHVRSYLLRKSGEVKSETYGGVEILVASDDERQAAAFVGDLLVLGTRDQIVKIIDTNTNRAGEDGDRRLNELLGSGPANASVISYRPRADAAGRLMLGVSELTRATDGSQELLNEKSIQSALERLPRSISFTMFRDYGVYVESKSAVGNLSAISGLIKTGD